MGRALEIIWNESKQHNKNYQKKRLSHKSNDDGLNESEFIIALQLISLAQASLPYNKHYLVDNYNEKQAALIPSPSILIDVAFIKYFETKEMRPQNNKNINQPLTELIPYIPS